MERFVYCSPKPTLVKNKKHKMLFGHREIHRSDLLFSLGPESGKSRPRTSLVLIEADVSAVSRRLRESIAYYKKCHDLRNLKELNDCHANLRTVYLLSDLLV